MVTLYNPPTHYYTGWHYDALPPLNLAIFAKMLKGAGIQARVIDLEKLSVNPKQIELPDSDVVGFTGVSLSARGVEDCIANLRNKGYTGRIVVGGVHATLQPEQVLGWGADLVVTGECDGNFVELLTGTAKGVAKGEPAPIEQIASPDWDACQPDVRTYVGQYDILKPIAGVGMWQRGCPYSCVFCGNVIYGGKVTRYRPPEQIADEMSDLHNRGIDRAYIYDDELVGTKHPDGWMKQIADLIQPLGMNWIAQGRCSERHITLDVLKDMHRAGCRMISWGVESLTQTVLTALDKRITLADIEHSLILAKKAGIANSLFLMVGNYTETENDLIVTLKALEKLHKKGLIDYLQVFIAKVFPGAPLEQISKREGWYRQNESPRVWIDETPYPTPNLTGAQIFQWRRNIRQSVPVGLP
jgi:anaerobic magnesium-protoporphyrin IX monomethyl ester cyclase